MDLNAMLRRPLAIVGAQFDRKEDRDDLTRIGGRLMTALSSAPLTFGFARGDLNSSNILFRDGGETVIDVDCCGWGYRAYDIAAFARGVTLTRMRGPEASALISTQLAGYVEVSPILPADAAAIPAFLLVQRLWMASLHYERQHRFGVASFGPNYTARLIAWLSAWKNVLDVPPDWSAAAN
jgi:Ser/Thr protein kinase RdoA (MazF antagonist)